MLAGRTVWCGCYISAHTERNNNQVSFSFITLISARSFSMCEVFWWLPSVWGESYMNGVVQEKRQPHQPYEALWWVSQWDYSWSNLVLCGKRLANALFSHRRFLDDDHVRQVEHYNKVTLLKIPFIHTNFHHNKTFFCEIMINACISSNDHPLYFYSVLWCLKHFQTCHHFLGIF